MNTQELIDEIIKIALANNLDDPYVAVIKSGRNYRVALDKNAITGQPSYFCRDGGRPSIAALPSLEQCTLDAALLHLLNGMKNHYKTNEIKELEARIAADQKRLDELKKSDDCCVKDRNGVPIKVGSSIRIDFPGNRSYLRVYTVKRIEVDQSETRIWHAHSSDLQMDDVWSRPNWVTVVY